MKRILTIVLILLLLCLSACNSESEASSVDVDISSMSSTVGYATLNQMWETPENYLGQTVRIKGEFSSITDGDATYYACVFFLDETRCCYNWIEFIPKLGQTLPSEGDVFTVEGTFDTYQDAAGYSYCTLRNASFSL